MKKTTFALFASALLLAACGATTETDVMMNGDETVPTMMDSSESSSEAMMDSSTDAAVDVQVDGGAMMAQ
jgi:uncharacterized protein YcfL